MAKASLKVMVLGIRGMPNVQGGVETHAEQLYTRLAALGCDVVALVRTPFVPRGQRSFGAIRLRRLWSPRRPGFEVLVHSFLGVLYAGIVRPDILHIHSIGPAIVTPLARILGLKVVVTYHSQNYEHEKWGLLARWLLRTGERVGMRQSAARIAVSKRLAEMIRGKYGSSVEYIPNGVVRTQPQPEFDSLAQFGLVPGKYFLQVGRVSEEKRQLDLIEAYDIARPEWRLAIVGGQDSSEYSRRVQRAAAAAEVVLTGFQSGTTLQQLYSHAGGFVLPSAHEGLPIALLEALSYGLPVLASDIPANLELGLEKPSYFPMGNKPELAAALASLASLPHDASVRDARSAWVAENFDWDRVARQTLDVYEAVVARH